jgi:hypothetical protein
METEGDAGDHGAGLVAVSLCGLGLEDFSLGMLPGAWAGLTSLDVSHNALAALPGLESLAVRTAPRDPRS